MGLSGGELSTSEVPSPQYTVYCVPGLLFVVPVMVNSNAVPVHTGSALVFPKFPPGMALEPRNTPYSVTSEQPVEELVTE